MITLTILIDKNRKTISKMKPGFGISSLVVFVLFLMALILATTAQVIGQEVWNLSRCVEYAIEHNIDLNQKALDVQAQKINVIESTAGLLPDLNSGTNASLNFGRNVDANNGISFNKSFSNNYWIESSINIFHGLIQINSILYNNYLHQASKEAYEIAKNKLTLDVLSAYYTVAYTRGLENVADEQVNVAAKQVEIKQRMVDLGKESPVVVQELKSQWAADKLSLAQAESNSINSIIALKQLLRLNESQILQTDTLELEVIFKEILPNADTIFNMALERLPDIRQQECLLSAADKSLAMAKGSISPRIYVAGGLGTYFYHEYGDSITINFKNQVNNNQSQYFQVGVNIPIFNRLSVYSNIKRKQIAVIDQQLAIDKAKEVLLAQIVHTRQDLESAEKEFLSTQEMLNYSEISFKQMEKKLENGLASPTEYATAKQRFVSAKANLLKSKLIYVMYSQMLEFYMNGNWEHIK